MSPQSCTVIRSDGFYGCMNLQWVNCQGPLELIEGGAFYHCCCIENPLVLPSSLKLINSEAFANCESIPGIVLKGCPDIKEDAFTCMDSVKYIQIPKEMEVPDHLWGLDKDQVEIKRV